MADENMSLLYTRAVLALCYAEHVIDFAHHFTTAPAGQTHAVIQNLQEVQVTLPVHLIAVVVLIVVDLRTQVALQDHHQEAHLQAEGKIKNLI
jgi:hypothetical protein